MKQHPAIETYNCWPLPELSIIISLIKGNYSVVLKLAQMSLTPFAGEGCEKTSQTFLKLCFPNVKKGIILTNSLYNILNLIIVAICECIFVVNAACTISN